MAEHSAVVTVVDVIEETPDAKSLVLTLPDQWTYQPGQFLTVRVNDVARHYSFCSSPLTGEPPKIMVKRVADGHASNWLCDNVSPGSTLECLPPGGTFVPASLDQDLLLLAGGSGITPMMSILKSVLLRGRGTVTLLYANREPGSIIFASELASLGAAHPDRMTVTHWLDSEQGPPTVDGLRPLITSHDDAFVCGPSPFMDIAQQVLGDGIHIERFTSLSHNPFEQPESERVASVQVTIDGQTLRFDWPTNTRLLDLLISKGLKPPFSCREGTCATCACRILEGEVKLVNNEVLEEEDFAEGYILACQALPITDEVTVTYE